MALHKISQEFREKLTPASSESLPKEWQRKEHSLPGSFSEAITALDIKIQEAKKDYRSISLMNIENILNKNTSKQN